MNEKITHKGTKTIVRARKGYAEGVDKLLILKDTANGFIAKVPSYSAAEQDRYICLDYSEAYYLWLALSDYYSINDPN